MSEQTFPNLALRSPAFASLVIAYLGSLDRSDAAEKAPALGQQIFVIWSFCILWRDQQRVALYFNQMITSYHKSHAQICRILSKFLASIHSILQPFGSSAVSVHTLHWECPRMLDFRQPNDHHFAFFWNEDADKITFWTHRGITGWNVCLMERLAVVSLCRTQLKAPLSLTFHTWSTPRRRPAFRDSLTQTKRGMPWWICQILLRNKSLISPLWFMNFAFRTKLWPENPHFYDACNVQEHCIVAFHDTSQVVACWSYCWHCCAFLVHHNPSPVGFMAVACLDQSLDADKCVDYWSQIESFATLVLPLMYCSFRRRNEAEILLISDTDTKGKMSDLILR